jgi:hypothetical protein
LVAWLEITRSQERVFFWRKEMHNLRKLSQQELLDDKLELEQMIDEGCYGVADYQYYLMILNELEEREFGV